MEPKDYTVVKIGGEYAYQLYYKLESTSDGSIPSLNMPEEMVGKG